jgi:hypothetical protein
LPPARFLKHGNPTNETGSMKKSTVAALLSALVFPGAGQLLLKRYFRGLILASIAIASLYALTVGVVERVKSITDKLIAGDVPIDATVISEMVAGSTAGSETLSLKIATLALTAAWLLAVVDAVFIGNRRVGGDKADN